MPPELMSVVCGKSLREVLGGATVDNRSFWKTRHKLGTNSHLFILWVDVVHKGVDRLREVTGDANVVTRL